ncbi:hypothetical protein BKA69DRAFT_325169 [Paraphysoderma sedebokerense]|nr:hypothetical protein BKA69DRAFT_325169 [Paraphysoderma sedebokerense]
MTSLLACQWRLRAFLKRTPLFASQSAKYISTQNDNKMRRQIGGPINAIGDEEKISPGKFFGIDPELYVLFGLVMGVCFSGGYLVGRKFIGGKPIDQITLADDVAYPWEEKDSSPENKYYKYKYKRPSDGATVAAPSAMTKMIVEVDPVKSQADPSLRLKEH